MSDAFDLSGDLPLETYDLVMMRPGTLEPTSWVVTLAGPSHPKALAYRDAANRKRLMRESAQEAAQINGRKYKPDVVSPEERERESIAWVVSRILTWTPVKIDGEVIAFSDAAASELLRNPKLGAFLQQILDYLQSDRAFMPASATI